jgi:hypothetical protein
MSYFILNVVAKGGYFRLLDVQSVSDEHRILTLRPVIHVGSESQKAGLFQVPSNFARPKIKTPAYSVRSGAVDPGRSVTEIEFRSYLVKKPGRRPRCQPDIEGHWNVVVGEGEPMFTIGRTAILLDGYNWFESERHRNLRRRRS